MGKTCWKCGQKIGLFEKSNRFLEQGKDKKNRIWLHNDCYLNLTKNEKKKILYDTKTGPPRGLRKNLKIEGFALGIVGGFGYSEGAFSGAMWTTRRIIKKKNMSFEQLDDICIEKYGYHYPILPDKLQNKILEELKDK